MASGGSAVRVGRPRARIGEKGVGSEAKVLVPGEDGRVSLEKTNSLLPEREAQLGSKEVCPALPILVIHLC